MAEMLVQTPCLLALPKPAPQLVPYQEGEPVPQHSVLEVALLHLLL